LKTKFSIFIISVIGIVAVLLMYGFYLFENSPEEYRDEQIRKIKTGNTHADAILSSCGNNALCTAGSIQKLSEVEKQEIVLTVIDELLDEFQRSELICWNLSLPIGEFLFGYANGNLTKAFTLASVKCGGALYHGIVINYLHTGKFVGSLKLEDLQISDSCDILSNNPQSRARVDCAHGFGHGMLKLYNYDISSTLEKSGWPSQNFVSKCTMSALNNKHQLLHPS